MQHRFGRVYRKLGESFHIGPTPSAARPTARMAGDCRLRTRAMQAASIVFLAAPTAPPVAALAAAEPPTVIPMTSEGWTLAPAAGWIPDRQGGKTAFASYEGFPDGVMTVPDEAIMVSRMAHLADGSIDFDIKPLAYSDTGIIFRRQGNDSGEFLYLRADPDCPAANDCIQYVPVTHGLMSWNIYSTEQGPAPITTTGWNHLRLMVAGGRMEVFVNHLQEPTLVVKLRGAKGDGGIAFKGPAVYANLVIKAGGGDALAAVRDLTPAPGTITTWRSAAPVALPGGRTPVAADIPANAAWKPIESAPDGLVDLGRAFGSPHAPAVATGWLQFTLATDKPARHRLNIGWAPEITVFLNGTRVYSGSNFYHPAAGRLQPDGRLESDNASIQLDLQRGENRIVLAVGNRWRRSVGGFEASPYGWGAKARLVDPAGTRVP